MFEYRGPSDRSHRDPLGWDDLFRGFDVLFREIDRDAPLSSFGRAASAMREEAERFVLDVEVPGLTDKDVKVDLHDGVLTVTAARTVEPPPAYTALRRERSAVRFSRSFTLGDRVDAEKTTAEIKDGVLTVGIGKAAGVQKKSIPVKVS
jgi:HSP20 family protein